jgi:hypothetical protein
MPGNTRIPAWLPARDRLHGDIGIEAERGENVDQHPSISPLLGFFPISDGVTVNSSA